MIQGCRKLRQSSLVAVVHSAAAVATALGMGVGVAVSAILELWVQVTTVVLSTRNGEYLTMVWKTRVAVKTWPSPACTAGKAKARATARASCLNCMVGKKGVKGLGSKSLRRGPFPVSDIAHEQYSLAVRVPDYCLYPDSRADLHRPRKGLSVLSLPGSRTHIGVGLPSTSHAIGEANGQCHSPRPPRGEIPIWRSSKDKYKPPPNFS